MLGELLDEIVSDQEKLVVVVGGGIACLWIFMAFIRGMVGSVSRERTKREIAAYIAEGSMSPEQGERILKAAPRPEQC